MEFLADAHKGEYNILRNFIKQEFTNHYKSSSPELFCKNGVFKNFLKFTGKHLCQNIFLNKVDFFKKETLT